MVQFIKGAWDTGERRLLTENFSDLCQFFAMGEGFTWETQDRARDIAAAEAGLGKGQGADPRLRAFGWFCWMRSTSPCAMTI